MDAVAVKSQQLNIIAKFISQLIFSFHENIYIMFSTAGALVVITVIVSNYPLHHDTFCSADELQFPIAFLTSLTIFMGIHGTALAV